MAEDKDEDPTFSVEFALIVIGRGLVAHCAVPKPTEMHVRPGDPIEFVRPDGSTFRTTVQAIDMARDGPQGRPGLLGLRMPRDVQKDDIPPGTRVRFRV
jgi:hypothetical protein